MGVPTEEMIGNMKSSLSSRTVAEFAGRLQHPRAVAQIETFTNDPSSRWNCKIQ